MSLDLCTIVDLPRIQDPRGNLTFVEGSRHVPFDIDRVHYLSDVPGGSACGGHTHKALHQFIIAMSGSFDVVLASSRYDEADDYWDDATFMRAVRES